MISILLNANIPGIKTFRTIYYLPVVLSGAVVSLLWAWILNPEFGLANAFLGFLGIEGPRWIYDESWVIPSLVIMSLWGVGSSIIIYLSGLQGIPTEQYEAARLDGAGFFKDWSI
jgi:multiple sugar transport system permease protein